jgi:HEAT repeat protein
MLAVFVVVAIALGWWLDHRRLTKRIELREQQLWHLQQPRGFPGAPEENRLGSVDEFLELLRRADENEFMDKAGPFVATDLAVEALPGLVHVLREPDPSLRTRSLQVLAWMGPRAAKAIPKVIALLDDESESVRWSAMRVLAECGPVAEDALPLLRRRMMDDSSPEAAIAAATVTKIDPSANVGERLCQLMSNSLPVNRWTAAQYVPDYVEPGVAQKLLEARYEVEDDATTCSMIAMSLNRLKESEAAKLPSRTP